MCRIAACSRRTDRQAARAAIYVKGLEDKLPGALALALQKHTDILDQMAQHRLDHLKPLDRFGKDVAGPEKGRRA